MGARRGGETDQQNVITHKAYSILNTAQGHGNKYFPGKSLSVQHRL